MRNGTEVTYLTIDGSTPGSNWSPGMCDGQVLMSKNEKLNKLTPSLFYTIALSLISGNHHAVRSCHFIRQQSATI
jgi:hypothetical protein